MTEWNDPIREELNSRLPMEKTHTRKTHMMRNDLLKRLDALCSQQKRGYKTRFVNQALEQALDMYDNNFKPEPIKIPSDREKLYESDLEDILSRNLDLVENGMELVKRQYKVDGGAVDILAKDINGNKVIIELKVVKNDKDIIKQSVMYPALIDGETRVITIAPGYTNNIAKVLASLPNVEMKTYNFYGDIETLTIDDFEYDI